MEGEAEGPASNGRLIEDWWGHVGLYDQPFRRAEAIVVLEPITVWRPLDGDAVGPSFIVEGEASTFEANVQVRIFDQAGDLVQEEFATATEGGPGRGSFRLEIRIQDPPKSVETWRLEAYETNQETGEDFLRGEPRHRSDACLGVRARGPALRSQGSQGFGPFSPGWGGGRAIRWRAPQGACEVRKLDPARELRCW